MYIKCLLIAHFKTVLETSEHEIQIFKLSEYPDLNKILIQIYEFAFLM